MVEMYISHYIDYCRGFGKVPRSVAWSARQNLPYSVMKSTVIIVILLLCVAVVNAGKTGKREMLESHVHLNIPKPSHIQ